MGALPLHLQSTQSNGAVRGRGEVAVGLNELEVGAVIPLMDEATA
jgi:hypothetical protein